MATHVSLAEARRIALAAQGFGGAKPARVGIRQLDALIRRLGLLQLDSVNVFERSHYLPVFARLGAYDKADLDRLTFTRGGRYLEYWAHEAAIIPVEDWPLWQASRDAMRAKAERKSEWVAANRPMLDWLLAELAAKGPMAASEIEHDASMRRGPWWGWSDVKLGLEYLFDWGDVVSAGRARFERSYALPHQVLPAAVLEARVEEADARAELVRRAARAHGIGTLRDFADYFRFLQAPTATAIERLVDEGELIPVTIEGVREKAWLHRDARIPRRMDAAALLSPFDPVVWERARALRLFGFHYRIEIYTPAPKRQFGYYSLPVLVGDRLVGRIDLKSDRKASTLRVQSAWTEADAPAGIEEAIAPLVTAAAAWQGLESVAVARWGDLAEPLAGALGVPPVARAEVD